MEGFQTPSWLLHKVTQRMLWAIHTPTCRSVAARGPRQATGLLGLCLLVPDRAAAPQISKPIDPLVLTYWAILNTLGGRGNVTGTGFWNMQITIECIQGHLLKSMGEHKHMDTEEGKGGGKNWETEAGVYSPYTHSHTLYTPHHLMGNRWGGSEILYLSGLQHHCRWWLQPWN